MGLSKKFRVEYGLLQEWVKRAGFPKRKRVERKYYGKMEYVWYYNIEEFRDWLNAHEGKSLGSGWIKRSDAGDDTVVTVRRRISRRHPHGRSRCICNRCNDCKVRKDWDDASSKFEMIRFSQMHKHLGVSKREWEDFYLSRNDIPKYYSGAYDDGIRVTFFALEEVINIMEGANNDKNILFFLILSPI